MPTLYQLKSEKGCYKILSFISAPEYFQNGITETY